MNTTPSSAIGLGIAPNPALARLLAALSIVLLVVFVATVLTTALPPNLLDPQWQLQLATTLISYATLPLVGALLLPLAVWVDPGNQQLRARRNIFKRWALAASLGFLLLIPLQGYAGWTVYRNATQNQEQLASQSGRKLTELRQAIRTANTQQELQARVQRILGPNALLSPAELRTPISELRQQLLARAEQASGALVRRIEALAARKPDQLVKETLRIAISAAAYAIGFAFLAGVLPRRGQAARKNRGVNKKYFKKAIAAWRWRRTGTRRHRR